MKSFIRQSRLVRMNVHSHKSALTYEWLPLSHSVEVGETNSTCACECIYDMNWRVRHTVRISRLCSHSVEVRADTAHGCRADFYWMTSVTSLHHTATFSRSHKSAVPSQKSALTYEWLLLSHSVEVGSTGILYLKVDWSLQRVRGWCRHRVWLLFIPMWLISFIYESLCIWK